MPNVDLSGDEGRGTWFSAREISRGRISGEHCDSTGQLTVTPLLLTQQCHPFVHGPEPLCPEEHVTRCSFSIVSGGELQATQAAIPGGTHPSEQET